MSTYFRALLLAIIAIMSQGFNHALAKPAGQPGMVVACSSHGNGCITVPVRKSPNGDQVRTPGGNWVDCRGDCAETLRQDMLDFWETQQEKAQILQ